MAKLNLRVLRQHLNAWLGRWERAPAPMPLPQSANPPRFAYYRILGNDLPPRHSASQTLDNVRFILENEPDFPNCSKYWVLNRITDAAAEGRLIDLLEKHGQPYERLVFDPDEYATREWDVDAFLDEDYLSALGEVEEPQEIDHRIEYRIRLNKNRYVMNNNGARNFALEHGRSRADYILPFDGSLFLTTEAWNAIARPTYADPAPHYLIVPMVRIGSSHRALLTRGIPLDAQEEPQIAFHRNAEARFNDALGYGHRPKVELLHRLKAMNARYTITPDRIDLEIPPPPSDHALQAVAGRIARLPSGVARQEVGFRSTIKRTHARNFAIVSKLDGLDRDRLGRKLAEARLLLFDSEAIEAARVAAPGSVAAQIRSRILDSAEAARKLGTFSVLDKTVVAASGNRRDYHSRAPYWWPDPAQPDGRPSIRRDGERVPEADSSRPEADGFDARRLQAVLAGTVASALAQRLTGEAHFGSFGADLVRRWFLAPDSAMRPNLAFAQVRPGHDGEQGSGAGLIELRGLPAFLDAVRLLADAGTLSPAEYQALQNWCTGLADWMRSSPQGREARISRNNIGMYYDLEMLALSAFIGDPAEIVATLRRMRVRLKFQFAADGSQPEEASRSRPLHYASFNLFGWAQFSAIMARLGIDVPAWGGGVLGRALGRLLAEGPAGFEAKPPGLMPTYRALEALKATIGRDAAGGASTAEAVEAFAPFWQLQDSRYLREAAAAVNRALPTSPALPDAPAA